MGLFPRLAGAPVRSCYFGWILMTGDAHAQPEFPDPGRVATQSDFGRELTLLRLRAGHSVRDVARAAGLPVSSVGDYFAGRHLPSPGQAGVLPRVLAACDECDPVQADRW